MSNAFMEAGWEVAETLLKGKGRRTIFSPWVTESQLLFSGDRLLIKGEVRDFAIGSSSINVIEELLSNNVEVRVCTNLHAKVYVLETENECLGWLGSAIFTKRGKKGFRGNIEAMGGIFTFDNSFMAMLETVWKDSEPINLRELKAEVDALRNYLAINSIY